jgi:hypothetical protein
MAFLFLMVVAGNETTTKLLGNAAYWGAKNPDQLAGVHADHSRIPLWVEETLRYDTSSQILARTVVEDIEFYGTTLHDGDTLLLVPGAAHRDERVFDAPDEFLIGRDIGSKIFPDADFRFFLFADPVERARRREQQGLQDQVAKRDTLDSQRLQQSLEGAVVIDSTHLTLVEVVDKIAAPIAEKFAAP